MLSVPDAGARMKRKRLVKALSDLLRHVTFPGHECALMWAPRVVRTRVWAPSLSLGGPPRPPCALWPVTVSGIQVTGGDTCHFVLLAKVSHMGWGCVIFSNFCFKIIDSQEITKTLESSVPLAQSPTVTAQVTMTPQPGMTQPPPRAPGLRASVQSHVRLSLCHLGQSQPGTTKTPALS